MAKYYWLRLHRDFFKRHDTQIVEGMENGKDYLLFYLKLLCESVDHEGALRFSDTIPYDAQMLATITRTNIDVVRCAVKVFTELNMMQQMDDGTLYMNQVQGLIGSETAWAAKKRAYRMQLSERTSEDIVRQEREIEIEIEKEEEKNPRYDNLVAKYGKKAVDEYIERVKLADDSGSLKRRVKDVVATAGVWLSRALEKGEVTTAVGYGVKAAPKLPTCACGGKLKEYEPGSAMCENRDSEWRLLNDLWVEVADE